MKINRNILKKDRDELVKLLKTVKRPSNKKFLEEELEEVELLLNPKIGSSNQYGNAKIF